VTRTAGPGPHRVGRRVVTAAVAAGVAAGAVIALVHVTASGGRPATSRPAVTTRPAPTTTSAPTTTTTTPAPTTTTDPGALPQTATLPTATTAAFLSRMAALWSGVTSGIAGDALVAFFPESAYVQLKQIGNPQGDFTGRLESDYEADVLAAHDLLGSDAPNARFLGVDVDEGYAHWVPPGVCDNGIGYYEVPNSRVVYSVAGQLRSFGIASMISWRGEWYVVHLGAILRSDGGGTVESPEDGPGAPTYSATC
jgi:hypothetical protein